MKNLITDVPGLLVGQAQDAMVKTGVTVITGERPFTAGVHVMGGAPGTRETELLAPDKLVQQVDALVLSGGSAFGLAAADGVMEGLAAIGRGFAVAGTHVPIVPAAIIFDLANGGKKDWGSSPYPALGRAAFDDRSTSVTLGSFGAGTGATTADLKGGLGSASAKTGNGSIVGALVAANPVGATTDPEGRFYAAPWEAGDEFGGHGISAVPVGTPLRTKLSGGATTVAVVATDAPLTQAQCTRVAVAAHDGLARAIVPSHTPFDGDLVFAASFGDGEPVDDFALTQIGHLAATTLARAIARAVYSATPAPADPKPTWASLYGKSA